MVGQTIPKSKNVILSTFASLSVNSAKDLIHLTRQKAV
jgi:hypothetical protein